MKVSFTNLYKANLYKSPNVHNKILFGLKNLIKKNQFIGGEEVNKFEKSFSKFIKTKHCITVANGTDALEIAIESLNLSKGSEIIVPVNTWISTAEAATKNGFNVVFCDISLDDYSIDIKDLQRKISNKTSAIIVVHLYGYPSKISEIKKIVKNKNIRIIEDCAQAHGTRIKKKHVGTFGDIATFSFFPGKNLGAFGDAGAIVTKNNKLNLICRRLKNHGALKKYDHNFIGRNSRLDSFQCFILSAKLKFYKEKIKKRIVLAKIYLKELKNISQIYLPSLDLRNNCNSFHQFVIRLNKRNELMKYLEKNNINTMIHYPYMLCDLKFYKKQPGIKTLKNSKKLGDKILSLPISEEHTGREILHVCKVIKKFFKIYNI